MSRFQPDVPVVTVYESCLTPEELMLHLHKQVEELKAKVEDLEERVKKLEESQ